MKVRIFGSEIFESKWVPRPRGWIAHRFLCDGQVAVHDVWYDQGWQHAVAFDHKTVERPVLLDWLQTHAPNAHITHPSGAVLFMDPVKALQFQRRFG
jgi:hypothetical protein